MTSTTRFTLICVGLAALSTSGCNPAKDGGSTMKRGNMYGIQSDEPAAPAAAAAGKKTTEGPGWDAVRSALLVADNCFASNLEYCVKDPDFVNPLIQGVLDKWYDGVMPSDATKLEEVKRSSKPRYTEALQSKEGLARIEKLVENRFNHPVVQKQGGAVIVDYGYLPTKLSVYRSRISGGGASEHLEGNQWKSSEVGAAFKKALDENPQAQTITLHIDIPSTSTSPRWTYSYNKVSDRMTIWTPTTIQGAYLTGPLNHDFSSIISGKQSLQTAQLTYDRTVK